MFGCVFFPVFGALKDTNLALYLQRKLSEKGMIYKSAYAGWYAVSDEAYYSENQVSEIVDPKTGAKSMVRRIDPQL